MSKKITTEEFIKKAKSVHGDKYDYSKVDYVNNSTKISINCPIHGEFEQRPNDHLSGKGCSKCSGVCKSTTEEFILKVKAIHGNKYDYSKVDYANAHKKVIIICPKHGEFKQEPNSHLRSVGCPKCKGIGLNYLSYEEAKIYIRNLGIKTEGEYCDWWKLNKPSFLPYNIDRFFKSNK